MQVNAVLPRDKSRVNVFQPNRYQGRRPFVPAINVEVSDLHFVYCLPGNGVLSSNRLDTEDPCVENK